MIFFACEGGSVKRAMTRKLSHLATIPMLGKNDLTPSGGASLLVALPLSILGCVCDGETKRSGSVQATSLRVSRDP